MGNAFYSQASAKMKAFAQDGLCKMIVLHGVSRLIRLTKSLLNETRLS